MRKAFLLALVVISSLSGLQAEYITEAVGDSLYIINNRTGEIHSFVRNGEIPMIEAASLPPIPCLRYASHSSRERCVVSTKTLGA